MYASVAGYSLAMARSKRRVHGRPGPKASAGRLSKNAQLQLAHAQDAIRRGDDAAAEILSEQVLSMSPRNPAASEVLSRVYARRGRYDLAVRRIEPVVADHPHIYELQRTFAHYLRRAGLHERAITLYEKLRRVRPDDPETLGGMCTSLVMTHECARVETLLEPEFAAGRATPSMSVTYVRSVLDRNEDDRAAEAARQHLARPDLEETHKRRLNALLGRALERLGRFDDAFAAYREAAEHERVPFDRARYRATIDALIAFFTTGWFERAPRSNLTTEEMVFIVGMPRSGSTLVERILDAHPGAHAVGEHHALFGLVERLKADPDLDGPWPQLVQGLASGDLSRLGREYLTEVRQSLPAAARGRRRIIDKALWNTEALGLVASMFPAAKVIWTRREPADTCISCFAESFDPALAPYASDLGNLGFVHRETERLMRHWTQTLPIPVRPVVYEEVVTDQEATSRAIVEFVGLPWHEDCLEFHRKASPAHTPSHQQVRQPMYSTSVARAQRFARHLDPLRAALDDTAP